MTATDNDDTNPAPLAPDEDARQATLRVLADLHAASRRRAHNWTLTLLDDADLSVLETMWSGQDVADLDLLSDEQLVRACVHRETLRAVLRNRARAADLRRRHDALAAQMSAAAAAAQVPA